MYFEALERRDTLSEMNRLETAESLQTVRADPYDENYYILIIDCTEKVKPCPDDWKILFDEDYTVRNLDLCTENVISRRILDEEGGLTTDLLVINVGVWLIAERISLNTMYTFWDYEGRKGEHIVIFSTQGNEGLQNEETLGSDIVDGSRVFSENRIAGYHISPYGESGCLITYMAMLEKTGAPDYIFKKVASRTLEKTFRGVVGTTAALGAK